MKTRFLNKMAGLLAVLLLFSCTGKFEEYNTDNTGFTDEQKTYDYNTFGVWLKVVQMGIYFNKKMLLALTVCDLYSGHTPVSLNLKIAFETLMNAIEWPISFSEILTISRTE